MVDRRGGRCAGDERDAAPIPRACSIARRRCASASRSTIGIPCSVSRTPHDPVPQDLETALTMLDRVLPACTALWRATHSTT